MNDLLTEYEASRSYAANCLIRAADAILIDTESDPPEALTLAATTAFGAAESADASDPGSQWLRRATWRNAGALPKLATVTELLPKQPARLDQDHAHAIATLLHDPAVRVMIGTETADWAIGHLMDIPATHATSRMEHPSNGHAS